MKYVVDIKGGLPTQGALRDAKPLNILDALEEVFGELCDNYCKHSAECKSDAELYEHCVECPMVKYL